MRVWLWDTGRHHGVSDDESRSLRAAAQHMNDGSTAQVELALAVISVREMTSTYIRTGTGWTGVNAAGAITWAPARAITTHPHDPARPGTQMEDLPCTTMDWSPSNEPI